MKLYELMNKLKCSLFDWLVIDFKRYKRKNEEVLFIYLKKKKC